MVRSPKKLTTSLPTRNFPIFSVVKSAGVVGFVAEREVELGGVADGFVNGKTKVAGKQHQILLAGGNRRRFEMLHHFVGNAAGVLTDIAHQHVFPTARLRSHLVGSVARDAVLGIDRGGVQKGSRLDE